MNIETGVPIPPKGISKSIMDVDQPNQSEADLLGKIAKARAAWEGIPAREAAEQAEIERRRKNGYCFGCESYCHGDCGHYSNDPATAARRNFAEAAREAAYGMED